MSEPHAKSGWRRFRNYVLLAGLVGLILLGALSWYATTDSFQALVRRRAVAELERITGGRVDLGGIHTVPFHFQVEIRDLTIHGREAANEVPYAHIDRLIARVKLISTLGAEFGFSSLVLDRPIIHIILYPDGTTNQPAPRLKQTSTRTPIEQLFSLSIDELEVRRGELLWNDQKTPFDFIAHDVSADASYSLLHRRYDGNLLLGKIDTRLENYRPLSWMVEAHFTLSENSIEVKSLTATSGRSRLQGSGRLRNFRQPSVDAKYDLTLDLGEADAVARRTEIRQGLLQATGEGSWSSAVFSSSGKLSVKNFDWRNESVGLHGAMVSSDYAISSQRLAFSRLQAKILGGEVTGDAEVIHWLNSAPAKTAKGNVSEEQKGSVRLQLKGVSASEIASALSSPSRPFQHMKLAGVASGSVAAQWKGSLSSAETEIVADVAAPTYVSAGELPINAHAHVKYRAASGALEFVEFNASTRATQVRAAGILSSNAAVNLSVTTSDLSEWQPILADVGYQQRIPVVLRGHASFTGTATGKLSAVAFAGKVQSEDFDLLIPATAHTPAKNVHCDSLAANVQLSPRAFEVHRGRLHHGVTTVAFDLSAGLQQRQFIDSSPIAARVDLRNADADEILALSGYRIPVSGTVNLSVQVQGTKAEPSGSGRIELSDAVIHGEPVQHLDSNLTFNRDQISLDDLHLTYYDARVTGDGTYNLSTHAFRFNLNGDNFDLARIAQLQATRVSVDGRMDFTAQASGTLEEPAINANIRLRDLAFDHERAGDYTFDAVTQGSELRVSGHSQFKVAELNIDGNVQLRGDWPSTINAPFQSPECGFRLQELSEAAGDRDVPRWRATCS